MNETSDSRKEPLVSIIIPTRNRLHQLTVCLNAIHDLDYPTDRFEVIVVDNGSTDGTLAYLEEMEAKTRGFRWFRCEKRGRAPSTNVGIMESKGEFILTTDDDAVVDPDWIRAHLREYKDQNVGAVGGMEHIRTDNLLGAFVCSRYVDEFENYMVIRGIEKWRGIATMNASYRRDALRRAGLFDEDFICGADPELVYRILLNGYAIVKNPLIRVTHLKEDSLNSFIRTTWKRGIGAIRFQMKHHKLAIREFIIVQTPQMILEDLQRFRRLTGIDRLDFSTAIKLIVISTLSYYVTHVSRLYHYAKFRSQYRV